jgi:type II secretory pathway pseudopilin PulG
MKNHRGLILIELIAVIILVGIIATFTGFFLYTGFRGYLETKNTTEGALTAQMALDRITLELRDLNYFTSLVQDSSLTYKSEVLDGTRILKYDSVNNAIVINIDNTDRTLLENVPASDFKLSKQPRDLDNDGADEVAYFEVAFRVGLDENRIGREFRTKIFPRHMVQDK